MRELIQKGDPMLRVELSSDIVQVLHASAKYNKRKIQDEIIKRLFKSFRYSDALNALQFDLLQEQGVAVTEKWVQVIPAEMMQALTMAATQKGLSIGEEVHSRLLATLKFPQEFGLNSIEAEILQFAFSSQDALLECKRRREAWLYLYEIEKLRLFLEFKANLPRNIKENFMCIDVQAMSEQIYKELQQKEKNTAK